MNQYITPLKKMALGQLEQEIKIWKEKTGVEFQKLLKILENYQQSLQNLSTKSKNILEPWLLCLDYSKQIRSWTLNIKNMPEICIQLNFFENWRNELTTNLENFPLTIKKNLEGIANQAGANETLKLKTWKWFIRRAIQLQSFITKTINWFRSLFKKEKKKRKILYNKISLRLFLEFYYGIPIAELYLKESQLFLQNISNSIQEIHQMNESHKDSVLGLENFREHLTALKPEDLRKYEQDIQEISLKVKEFINQIIKSESNLVSEFEKNFEQIQQKLSQKAELVGTPLLPKRSFGQRKIRENWNHFEKNVTRFKSMWEKHYLGEQEDWQKDLDLATVQFELGIIEKKQLLVIEGKIKNKFTPEFSKVKNLLIETEQKFKSFSFDDSKELRSKLVQENRIVLKLLRQNVLPDLTDIIFGANIKQDFQEILGRSQAALEQIAEQHNIFKHRDFENLPPESKIENIPLKELLNEEYGNAFTIQHKALQEDVHEKLDSIFRDISEIDQIVEFNLEAAINLLTESEEDQSSEVYQMVIDGLGRTQSHIDSLVVKSKDLSDFVEEKQTEVTLQLEEKIQKLADNEKIIELKFQIAKTKAKEELRARWRKALITLRRILPIVITYSKKNLNDLYQKYSKFRRLTGLAPISIQIEDEIIQFLLETQKRIKSLPYVYQRLFRIEPLEDERFFSARKSEMSALEDQFEMWLSGQYANTALVGERGSGKTTLINFAKQKFYKNHTIYQYDFNRRIYNENELLEELKKLFKCSQAKDFLELENFINQQNETSIVVFENLQNLFIRKVNGFKALEKFLLFASRTHSKIYWLVSCTLYSWEYLNKVVRVSNYFNKILSLKDFPQEEVENIILKRHRVSGYKLVFIVPDEISKSKKFKKLGSEEEQQSFLQSLFFKYLDELSKGNIAITLLFWLRAIQELSEDKISIYPLITFDFSFLNQLPIEEVFTLVAFLQHEHLKTEEFSEIFNQNIGKTSLLLTRLYNSGILLTNERGFYIHPFLYRSVVRALKSKNLLN